MQHPKNLQILHIFEKMMLWLKFDAVNWHLFYQKLCKAKLWMALMHNLCFPFQTN